VPGQHRQRQAKFLGEQRGDPGAIGAQGGQGARGAAELHRKAPGPHAVQVRARFVQAGQPAGRDQAEGHGDRLLQQGPADHHRVAVRCGEPGGGVRGRRHIRHDRRERAPGEQHGGGVDDVLARRAPVHGRRRGRGHAPGQRPDQRGHGVCP
jgi:hypothetical protein